LPPDIADLVEGILGLDNRRLGAHSSNGGSSGVNPLTPLDVANFYNFPLGALHSKRQPARPSAL
jgi:hypothetical protein